MSKELTDNEREQIAEILDRRSNDVASFKQDVEQRLKEPLGYYRGSVEMAITREITRLRKLADKIRPAKNQNEEGEE